MSLIHLGIEIKIFNMRKNKEKNRSTRSGLQTSDGADPIWMKIYLPGLY